VYVSLIVIKRNIDPVHIEWVGRRGWNKKERRKKRNIYRHVNSSLIIGFYHDRMKTVPHVLTYVSETKPDITPILCSGFPQHPFLWFFPNQNFLTFCIFSHALYVNRPPYIKETSFLTMFYFPASVLIITLCNNT